MSTHLSDEEQLETLKRWWREHGIQWALIIVVGVGGWFGWNYWKDNREARAQAASLAYTNLIMLASESENADAERLATLHGMGDELRDAFPGSVYVHYTAMLQARLAVDAGDYQAAADYLRMVLDSKADEATALVARLRLARVLGSAGEVDEGLRVLDAVDPKDFAAQYAEARGDLLMLNGDAEGARAAYAAALQQAGPGGQSPLLELKLSQLSSVGLVPAPGLENDIAPILDYEVDNL